MSISRLPQDCMLIVINHLTDTPHALNCLSAVSRDMRTHVTAWLEAAKLKCIDEIHHLDQSIKEIEVQNYLFPRITLNSADISTPRIVIHAFKDIQKKAHDLDNLTTSINQSPTTPINLGILREDIRALHISGDHWPHSTVLSLQNSLFHSNKSLRFNTFKLCAQYFRAIQHPFTQTEQQLLNLLPSAIESNMTIFPMHTNINLLTPCLKHKGSLIFKSNIIQSLIHFYQNQITHKKIALFLSPPHQHILKLLANYLTIVPSQKPSLLAFLSPIAFKSALNGKTTSDRRFGNHLVFKITPFLSDAYINQHLQHPSDYRAALIDALDRRFNRSFSVIAGA